MGDRANQRAHYERELLFRRLEPELDRDDGSPPLELPERFEEPSDDDRLLLPLDERLLALEERLVPPLEDRLLLPPEDRLRPLDELAALASPDFEPLRRARLPLPEDALFSEDLTSASSIVPRHSPDSCSFIMMYAL